MRSPAGIGQRAGRRFVSSWVSPQLEELADLVADVGTLARVVSPDTLFPLVE